MSNDISKNIEKHFKDFMSKQERMFISEADFQFNFGRYLDKLPEVKEVIFEYAVRTEKKNEYIDLVVKDKNNKYLGIELKYNTKKEKIKFDGREFILKNQGAHDLTRVSWVKDVFRLEKFINKDKIIDKGVFIGLTNDKAIWNSTKRKTVDRNFRFYDSNDKLRIIKGELDSDVNWFKKYIGKEPIKLEGSYTFKKNKLKEIKVMTYYYSLVITNNN